MVHLEKKGGKEGEILRNLLGHWGHGDHFLIGIETTGTLFHCRLECKRQQCWKLVGGL